MRVLSERTRRRNSWPTHRGRTRSLPPAIEPDADVNLLVVVTVYEVSE